MNQLTSQAKMCEDLLHTRETKVCLSEKETEVWCLRSLGRLGPVWLHVQSGEPTHVTVTFA